VRRDAGSLDEAQEFFTKAAEVRLKKLGPAHPRTLDSLTTLATLHTDRKQNELAEKAWRRIVEIRERVDGPDAIAVAAPLEALALILESTDRAKEGEEVKARAAKIREAAAKAATEAKQAAEKAEGEANAETVEKAAAEAKSATAAPAGK